MFDIFKESTEQKNKKSISRRNSIKTNTLKILNDFNEVKSSVVDTNQSGSQSPSSFTNPTSPIQKNASFLQNISFKTLPSFDQLQAKVNQMHTRAMKFVKVSNDLKNKIELLVEIYDGPEYRKSKTVNKLVQCNIDIETPQKIVSNLILKSNSSGDMSFGRSIHPAYSNEIPDENQSTMDSLGVFKTPGSYHDQTSQELQPLNNDNNFVDFQSVDAEQLNQEDSIFLEHEGNTYVRVDDANYHLIQSITEDGLITTETGLQFSVPVGIKIPFESSVQELIQDDHNISNNNNIDYVSQLDQNQYYVDNIPDNSPVSVSMHPNRKNYNDNGYLSQYTYQTSNSAKPFSDYVGLPPRPVPHTPFTLSSQLYTPELSISLTDRDCELMLTIDCSKKSLAQQPPLYYQIYSYKDEDRYTKPTSEVWGLVGEISACPLPMFCTISIPSGVHKHYFSIRSVDEYNRFSDWSNVVQVEVESNHQNSTNGR